MSQFQSSVVIVNLVYVSDELGVEIQKPLGKNEPVSLGFWNPLKGLAPSIIDAIPVIDRPRLARACALAFADQRPTT